MYSNRSPITNFRTDSDASRAEAYTNESLATISALLEQQIGLNVESIGGRTLSKAIGQRMAATHLTDIRHYVQRLHTSTQELGELIELVVIPETWFFRDIAAFRYLVDYLQSEWLQQQSSRLLRILSLPCCTGEEPYSIAITLLEQGLAEHQFRIDAIDISQQSLRKAKQAIYTNHSFRGTEPELRQRYFTPIDNGYQLLPSVRGRVNFSQGNLLDPIWLLAPGYYDVVFCRNVLIYLSQTSRDRALQILEQALSDQGLLFLGCSESGSPLTTHFVPVNYPRAFGYRKRSIESVYILTAKSHQTSFRSSQSLSIDRGNSIALENTQSIQSSSQSPQVLTPAATQVPIASELASHSPEQIQTQVKKIIAQQQIADAIALCQTYLKVHRGCAEIYLLLGQLHHQQTDLPQAEQCFRRVLYLNPQHAPALTLLADLREQLGDRAEATRLQARLDRLTQ